MMPAIYNVADMFIVTMMIGVALLVLVGLHLDGTRERRRGGDDDDAARRGRRVPRRDGGAGRGSSGRSVPPSRDPSPSDAPPAPRAKD